MSRTKKYALALALCLLMFVSSLYVAFAVTKSQSLVETLLLGSYLGKLKFLDGNLFGLSGYAGKNIGPLVNNFGLSGNVSETDFYNSGYSAGWGVGNSSGWTAGNSSGYTLGWGVGNSSGFAAGVASVHWITPAFNWSIGNPSAGQNVTFTSYSSSSSSITNYLWHWGDGSSDTSGSGYSTAYHVFASNGTYQVTLTVTSAAGSSNLEEFVVVGYPTESWIQSVFTWSPSHPNATQTVTFTSHSISHSPITDYLWQFEQGGSVEGGGQTSVGYQFDSDGVYLVNLTVTSAEGSSTLTEPVVVGLGSYTYAMAAFNWTAANPTAGDTVHFVSYMSSYPPIMSWHWTFGNGAEAESTPYSNVNYTYAAAGVFQVTLNATNGVGLSYLMTEPITVNAIATPTPSPAPSSTGTGVSEADMTVYVVAGAVFAAIFVGMVVLFLIKRKGGSESGQTQEQSQFY